MSTAGGRISASLGASLISQHASERNPVSVWGVCVGPRRGGGGGGGGGGRKGSVASEPRAGLGQERGLCHASPVHARA
jgi:hypothetical protein